MIFDLLTLIFRVSVTIVIGILLVAVFGLIVSLGLGTDEESSLPTLVHLSDAASTALINGAMWAAIKISAAVLVVGLGLKFLKGTWGASKKEEVPSAVRSAEDRQVSAEEFALQELKRFLEHGLINEAQYEENAASLRQPIDDKLDVHRAPPGKTEDAASTVAHRLQDLDDLHTRGLISENEFLEHRRRILESV